MPKPKLKIHQWIQDDINWIKLKSITFGDLTSYQRIRNNNAVPLRRTLERFVTEYALITGDTRDIVEIKLDLLSPVEDFISG